MTNIFTYLDYRKFLRDFFEEAKTERETFSHRSFARTAGFSSSNFVLLIMQGKRNLSSEGILKVAKALKLKKKETEFFENLVRFNQAQTEAERNYYYLRIAANRDYAKARLLEKEQFDYYSNWYIPAIREMVLLQGFQEDPVWIASNLRPQISPKEAQFALNLLIDLGLLLRDETGKLVQQDRHIASGDEVSSMAMTNFQREMIQRAADSIDNTEANLREIGSLTFAVSRNKLSEAKKMIREFRSRLAGFLAEDQGGDAVYQLNFQLFNLSALKKQDEE